MIYFIVSVHGTNILMSAVLAVLAVLVEIVL